MAATALILYAVYLLLTFGLRIADPGPPHGLDRLSRRSVGARARPSGSPASASRPRCWSAPRPRRWSLLDVVEPIAALDTTAVHVVGLDLSPPPASPRPSTPRWRWARAGGSASRNPSARELVTSGPFARRPQPDLRGDAADRRSGWRCWRRPGSGSSAFGGLLAALELQVRVVEEPHLLRAHGGAYASYAARVGRFVPGVGRLRRAATRG